MKKILADEEPERLDLHSSDAKSERIEALLQLFPEIKTDGKRIDFDTLKRALGEHIDSGKERYGLSWPGKAQCYKTIQSPSIGTLLPLPEQSISFEHAQNAIIEGDNLEVLKLLQKAYIGKIRMIYIDPPYNTGKDFIYPDDFSESLATYLEYTGQVDASGRKFSTNLETDGRFHSRWLNMMYPRLYLSRSLLSEDGAIFISIDDHEVANLKKICDEIFGEENFLSQLTWRTDGNFDNQAHFKRCHEYILVYAKHADLFPAPPVIDPSVPSDSKLFRAEIRNTIVKNGPKNPPSKITLPAGFPSDFESGSIPSRTDSWPHFLKEARIKDGCLVKPTEVYSGWSSKELLLDFIEAGCKPIRDAKGQETQFVISRTGAIEAIKTRSSKQSHVISTLSGLGGPQKGNAELEALGVSFPDYPKPSILLKYLVSMIDGNDFTVLDFFAGSGTLGQAVLELNREDGGNRKFVLVQLPEAVSSDSTPTIADICRLRVRKVVEKLTQKGHQSTQKVSDLKDLGFRSFKLSQSNFLTWDSAKTRNSTTLQKELELHIDHIRDGRSTIDILFEMLLKSGFPLSTRIDEIKISNHKVFSIADGALLICLEQQLTIELIRAIAARKPERFLCLDRAFLGNDQLKANAAQIFKTSCVGNFKTA